MNDLSRARDLSELVRLYSELLYRFAYRLCGSAADAEDLTQQTFVTAYRKLDQLRAPDNVRGWLCAILRNHYLKGLRKHSGTVSLEQVLEIEDEQPSEALFDTDELQLELNELPEEFRTPVILYYFEDLSYKEIARHLEIPLGTVMSRLARAKQQLRTRLAAREPVVR